MAPIILPRSRYYSGDSPNSRSAFQGEDKCSSKRGPRIRISWCEDWEMCKYTVSWFYRAPKGWNHWAVVGQTPAGNHWALLSQLFLCKNWFKNLPTSHSLKQGLGDYRAPRHDLVQYCMGNAIKVQRAQWPRPSSHVTVEDREIGLTGSNWASSVHDTSTSWSWFWPQMDLRPLLFPYFVPPLSFW